MTFTEIASLLRAQLQERQSAKAVAERYGFDFDELRAEAGNMARRTIIAIATDPNADIDDDVLDRHLAVLWVGGVLSGAAYTTNANEEGEG